MSIANSHERNTYVDALRGIAMLMVVLQHTMVGCTDGAEQSFLFQIVWSLQMPLFMLISGYVTRYSRRINSGKALVGFIWKRTTAYLWPWLVWTVIIRGLVFGNRSFLNPSHILWHMDSGYWFLFSIWTISMAFGISQFCANVIIRNKSDAARILSTGTIYGLSMVLLAGIGYVFGLSFLCIKLTLYYMPFYFLGYLFGQSQEHLFEHKHANKCVELVVGVAFILWIVILSRYNLYEISDSGFGIIVRAAASLAGCIAVCGLMNNVRQSNGTANYGGGILWCGKHSLEIYLVHYLVLNLLQTQTKPQFLTVQGLTVLLVNLAVTLLATWTIVILVNRNKLLRGFIFGKRA